MLRSSRLDWIHGTPGAPYIMQLDRPEYLQQQGKIHPGPALPAHTSVTRPG